MPFTPAKVMIFTMSGTVASAFFPDDDGWQGYPYQWTTTLSVPPVPHGSEYTPTPYYYTCADVVVGDCITTTGQGRMLKIVAISSQVDDVVECTVEDWNRENIMSDQTQSGDGGIIDGVGVLFSVKNGMPILHPLPDNIVGSLPHTFSADIIARFMNSNTNGTVCYHGPTLSLEWLW